MKRLNPQTGKPFKHGDVREDGYVFKAYNLQRLIKRNGYFHESWKNPKSFNIIKEKNRIRLGYSNAQLKQECLDAYGGKCAHCGEKDPIVLTIDHINDDGAIHRKVIGGGGNNTYAWLRRNGFPKDNYQILCANCNMRKESLRRRNKWLQA